jgi:Holliday junction resolvasome RuvABC ATP-dependent DNA helicase subunit
MIWKPILVLSLSFIAFGSQSPQLKMSGERAADALPRELTETEAQNILKENGPKPRIDATLKVSDLRLVSALKFADESQYKSAVQDVDVYAALIVYADSYTRGLPASQTKDRNNCLKKIEQAIFKQTRAVEAVLRQFPVDYREEVGPKIDQVKQIRLRAVNDLLGGGNMIKTSE